MTKLLLISLLFVSILKAASPIIIGNGALIATPSSSEYVRSGAGRQPDNNSVQLLNPPVFSWLYYEDPQLLAAPYNQTRAFRHKLWTNGVLYWTFQGSNNFFNFFPSITNADGSIFTGTCSWSVEYWNSNNTVQLGTNALHTFTNSANAVNWDRSCFSDVVYLASLTNHHMLYAETNKAAFRTYLQTISLGADVPGVNFSSTYTQILTMITGAAWTNTSAITNAAGWEHLPGNMAILGAAFGAVTNAGYTNAIVNASPSVGTVLTNWLMNIQTQRLDQIESYQGNTIADIITFSLTYRAFRDIMTSGQRSLCVTFANNWIEFMMLDWWYASTLTPTDRNYAINLVTSYAAHNKMGDNHAKNDQVALMLCMAFCDESATARKYLEYFLGYYIVQLDPFQASDDGMGYSTVQNFAFDRQYPPWVIANMFFAGKGLTNAPSYIKLADMMQHQAPVGYRARADSYGQVNCADCLNREQQEYCYTHFYVEACLMQRGDHLRQYRRTSTLNNGYSTTLPWLQAIVPFYWPVPSESDAPTNMFLHIQNGWAMGANRLPSEWGAHSNGLHWVMQDRPAGGGRLNSDFNDGQIVLDAYGANIMWGGAGAYEQANIFHPLQAYVDGVGVNNPCPPINYPVLAAITAFTNGGLFQFSSAELGKAFNTDHWTNGCGSGNIQSSRSNPQFDYCLASNSRPDIISVKEHLLFVTNGFWLVRWEFNTTSNRLYQTHWPIWDSNAVFNTGSMSFAFSSTNNFNRSNVVVYCQILNTNTTTTWTNLHTAVNYIGGSNACLGKMNPFTGENYAGTGDWYAGDQSDQQHYPANSLWTVSRTPATNYSITAVIFPVHWEQTNAPTFRIIDESTVAITNANLPAFGGVSNIFSFNTNQLALLTSATDIMINTGASSSSPDVPLTTTSRGIIGKGSISGKVTFK